MKKYILSFLIVSLAGCSGNRVVNDTFENQQPKMTGALKYHKQEGLWKYYYEDGTLKSEGAWKADYQDGPWVYYYPNGKKKQEGSYVNKHRHGLWTYYHDNGSVKSAGYYDNDRQDGLWRYFRADGSVFAIGQFAAGIKHGLWQWYDASGKTTACGIICDGMRVGRWMEQGKQIDKGLPDGYNIKQAQQDGSFYAGWLKGDVMQLQAVYTDKQPVACYDPEHGLSVWQTDDFLLEQSSEHSNVFTADFKQDADPTLVTKAVNAFKAFEQGMQHAFARLTVREPLEKAAPSVEEIIISHDGEPELTPVVHIGSLWTKREEQKVPKLVARYNTFMPGDDEDRYSSGMQKERDMEEAWLNKPLPQTRFFTASGSVMDLNDFNGSKSVSVIVMRGFAGQVCVYCSTQTRVIAERIADFKKLNNEVIIVYPGPAETIPMFFKAVESVGGDVKDLNIVLDVNLNLVKALDITKDLARPSSLILDKTGKVVYAYKGKNMGDRPSAKELLSCIRRLN